VIVADASAILELLLQTDAAPAIEALLFAPGETLHAPHLLDVEILHTLRRYAAAGIVKVARAAEAISDLEDLLVTRHRHDQLLWPIWALRHNVSAYDAVYVALAEALGATLVTRDRRLASAVGRVEVV
jgi:predicted nucleic acid-binding protein